MSRNRRLIVLASLVTLFLVSGVTWHTMHPDTVGTGITSPVTVPDTDTDTSVCYESSVFPGVWLSDYSTSGYCTFGLPLDTDPTTIGRATITPATLIETGH